MVTKEHVLNKVINLDPVYPSVDIQIIERTVDDADRKYFWCYNYDYNFQHYGPFKSYDEAYNDAYTYSSGPD